MPRRILEIYVNDNESSIAVVHFTCPMQTTPLRQGEGDDSDVRVLRNRSIHKEHY